MTTTTRLAELLAKATAHALPWHVEPHRDEDGNQIFSDDINKHLFCVCHPKTECDATTVVSWISYDDATLIVEAVNALPTLLSTIDTQAAEIERLRGNRRFETQGGPHD